MAGALESPPLPAPCAPGPPRPAPRALPYAEPGAPAPRRVCEPVTWFPLQPSRLSTRAAAAKSRQTRLRQGRSEEMASRPHALPPPPPGSARLAPDAPRRVPARLPPGSLTCPALRDLISPLRVLCTHHPGWPPSHLPPQVQPFPLFPVPAEPSTQGAPSPPDGNVAAVLVAAHPPTRLRVRGGSGLGVIPLAGKEEGMGDQ